MGFWSKLGKIGLIAGGAAATGLTGGAAMPLLTGALGAVKNLNAGGGLKGALSGGAMGALSGVGGGAAGTMLGTVGKLASAGGGASSALGTAGQIAGALGPNIGATAGALAAGRQAGRETDTRQGQAQDRNAIDLYGTQNQANTAQNNFGIQRGGLEADRGALDLKQRQFGLDAAGQRAKNSMKGDYLANAKAATFSGLPGGHDFKFDSGFGPGRFSENTRALGRGMSADALKGQQAGDTFAPMSALPEYHAGPASPSLTAIPQAGKFDSILNTASTVGGLAGTFGDMLKNYRPQDQLAKSTATTGPNPPAPDDLAALLAKYGQVNPMGAPV